MVVSIRSGLTFLSLSRAHSFSLALSLSLARSLTRIALASWYGS